MTSQIERWSGAVYKEDWIRAREKACQRILLKVLLCPSFMIVTVLVACQFRAV
jgi:hypothetical protein